LVSFCGLKTWIVATFCFINLSVLS
jgi:hypothetical protein